MTAQQDEEYLGIIPPKPIAPLKIEEDNPAQMTTSQTDKLQKLLEKYDHLFSADLSTLGCTDRITCRIDLDENLKAKQQLRQQLWPQRHNDAFIKSEIDRMLKYDIIEPSRSPYGANVVVVGKKNGKQRFCCNYPPLNKCTIPEHYPFPKTEEVFNDIGNAKWFSALDLASGFWQVPLDVYDREKTAFITRYGSYQFKRMPFGLTNAPAIFQRLMDMVLDKYRGQFVNCFIDDILVYSNTFDEHIQHLEKVFNALYDAGLKLNKEKSHFIQMEVTFLGHIITPNGNKPDLHNSEKIRNYPAPRTVTQVREFLGLVGYYRSFIQDYSHHAEPLTALTRKATKFTWNELAQQAFEYLKQKILEEPILVRPDYNKPFILYTDASDYAIGGILGQLDDNGKEVIVKFLHKTLSQTERNYGATERECFAAIWCMNKCKPYLLQHEFKLYVDHSALKWLFANINTKTKFQRWQITLSEFKFKVIHKPGKTHTNADALSRLNFRPPKTQKKPH
jgi:hypothetical protein